jgi:hypothetical protein
MSRNAENVSMMTDDALATEPGVVELDEALIDAVAGGINPQPLPPRHELRLD